jgi:bifunctional DNA-binding transcriptional regulator/antitoxin component of YhaV-PrlF toxin-antitoxin module
VIPEEIRESMDIKPGMEFESRQEDGLIEIIPVRDIRQMRGFLKGIDTAVERDEGRL